MLSRIALIASLSAAAACGQGLSFGLKLGHPLNDAFRSALLVSGDFAEAGSGRQYLPDSSRYIVGPTVELRLPMRISASLDILYRPLGYKVRTLTAPVSEHKVGAGQWQFPIMVKYRLRSGFVTPYAGGGVSFQRVSGLPSGPEVAGSSSKGLVLAGGLEGRLPVFRLSGELRYTRWGSDLLRFNLSQRNQVELLVGVTF